MAEPPIPSEWRNDPAKRAELEKRMLALVAKESGNPDERSRVQYRKLIERRGFVLSDCEFNARLDRARARFFEGDVHLFLCTADPCCNEINFDFSESVLSQLQQESGIRITAAACLWQCGDCPIAVIRAGDESRTYAHFPEDDHWMRIVRYATRCSVSGEHQSDAGADEHRFVPARSA